MQQKPNRFTIKRDSRIIIYGASFVGRKFFHELKNQGILTKAFLDINASVIGNIEGVPVYTLDSAPFTGVDKNDVIVIVAVTNAQEHPFIADYLHQAGYTNILYKSGNNEFAQPADLIYEGIFNGTVNVSKGIEVEECYSRARWADRSFLRELDNGRLLVLIPMELLFIGDQRDGAEPMEMGFSLKGKPLMGAVPLLSAYDYFEGKDTDSFEAFIRGGATSHDSVKDSAGWIRWLEERRYESRTIALESALDSRYFEKFPVEVEWSSLGLFSVVSHYRQAVYRIARNHKLIPCSVTRDAYAEWRNEPQILPCIETLKKNRLSLVYTPILHPNFVAYPCMRENYGATRLMKICKYLYSQSIDPTGKKVLDAGSYLSYFAQNFSRMGAHVTSVEFDPANYEPACAINKLLRRDDIIMINGGIEELNSDMKFDITIMTSVLNWHLDKDLGKEIICIVDKVTENMLIWESGDEIEREKQFIIDNSSFKKYIRLQSTFGTGKLREFGVFSK